MLVTDNYNLLIGKLDEFIRKYYMSQLIRGMLYALAVLLASYISLVLLEHYSYFDSSTRTILFYSFIVINALTLYYFAGIPALAYYHLGTVISHQKASEIIGQHFTEVKDKLLNTLELHQLFQQNPDNAALIIAGINQKIGELKPIPFVAAINLAENKKYVKYAAVPLAVILVLLFAAPSMLTESTKRLVNHDTYFEKKAPFQFNILNDKLEALQNENFTLNVKFTGTEIPQDVYVVVDDVSYKLAKQSIIEFTHEFKNLQKTQTFTLLADGFTSKEYTLKVVAKPTILNFSVALDYPLYTGKKREVLQNTGDLTLPAGTKVTWTFNAANADAILFAYNGTAEQTMQKDNNVYAIQKQVLKNGSYMLQATNSEISTMDSISYTLTAIPDAYPTIKVQERADSLNSKTFYFVGQVQDDYGFKKLLFNYTFLAGENQQRNTAQMVAIPVATRALQDNFFYYWNFSSINVSPGDVLEYYFEVFDNDGVHGSKSTRSDVRTLKIPSRDELNKENDKNAESIKNKMAEAIREAKKIETESKKLREKLLDKKSLNFEEKKAIKDLANKQKQLEQLVDEIKKDNERNNLKEQEYTDKSEQLLEKQKQLEKLLDKVLDEKTKQLIEELKKLLEEDNKNKTQDQLEKLQQETQSLEKELDRALELFKQLEVEKKLEENINQLDKLAEKEEKLATKTEEKQAKNEALKEEQDKLNKEFDALKESMKELDEKNKELESPTEFDNTEEQQQEIGEEMENSSEQLQNNKSQKAAQSQKSASDKMKELSAAMKAMQQEMEAKELELDLKALRELLENLIKISFDQEKVMNDFKKITINDPQYTQLIQKQNGLKDDLKMVEDSLYALSKRVVQIESVVNKEIGIINQNVAKAIENLTKRNTAEAQNRQQYVMTSANNLAVMLSEVFDQLQQQLKQKMEGKGKGGKPQPKKGNKPGMQQLGKMQEQLNKQLQEMKEGGMKPGQKPGKGQMSEQLAKMAAQQQAIRNTLQQISKEENKDGKGKLGNLDKLAKDMEKTETDIYNKLITEETLRRQQEIMTRLLEAEKAEREREFDNQRQAKQGTQQQVNYAIVFEEYKKLKQRELELLQTVPPQLNQYYKDKINLYFNQLNRTK